MATVGESLRGYFLEQGLPEDGGVDLAWVHLKIGPIPIAFPNIGARRDAVRFHDVHHLVTGYQTDWAGEAEIGAWEIASGCGRYWVAWLLNSGAMGFGAVLWPRRTFGAFVRGRNSRNLYREQYDPVLGEDVDALRERLELTRDAPSATMRDVVFFMLWAALGFSWMVLLPVVGLLFGVLWLIG